jgi:hypothetical protein
MHLDIYKKLNEVRKLLPPVFDVQEFAHFFPEKTAPLKFCERLVHQGLLIRLKRGTYAYHEVNALVAANYIAPCSYVSFESALSYYGMIPEFTPLIMSVSSVSRHRSFTTPIASYEYFHQQAELYAAGMDLIFVDDDTPLLIATQEKALCDALARRSEQYHAKDSTFMGQVLSGLRIDRDTLRRLDVAHIRDLAELSSSKAPALLHNYLREQIPHEQSS